MENKYKNLGKVRPTVEGDWNKNKSYRELSIVFNEESNKSYISKKDVPENIEITNKKYWQCFGSNRIDSDSIILLSNIKEQGVIKSYSLQEAIASISPDDRRVGVFISFYEKPNAQSDVYRWNLYQFNSNNISDWNDETAWSSIYFIKNKFYGWFINEELLYKTIKNPSIGDYAFVGNNLGEAIVYLCYNKHTWSATTNKATDYLTIIFKGTITIGENGNWYQNGEDTGIAAKGEKGDKPYFRFNDTTGNIEYSFNQTDWEVLVNKEEITGAAATVTVGTVTTLDENSNAQVTNSGTTNAAILNFKIPKGKTGDGLIIKGTYDTEEILKEKITNPKIGDNYVVGTAEPYHLWCYTNVYNSETDSTIPQWKDLGELSKDTTIITQSLGDSETAVISQKTITEKVTKLEAKTSKLNSNIDGNIIEENTDSTDDFFEFQNNGGETVLSINKDSIECKKSIYDKNGEEIVGGTNDNIDGNIIEENTDSTDDFFEFQNNGGETVLSINKDSIECKKSIYDKNGEEIVGGTNDNINGVQIKRIEDSNFILKYLLPEGLAFSIKGTEWGFGAMGLKSISDALNRYNMLKDFSLKPGEYKILPYVMAYADVTYGTTFRFDGTFSGTVAIGRGYKTFGDNTVNHTTNAGWLEITSDKIIEKAYQFTWSDYPHTYKEYTHGFTLKSPMSIIVQTKITDEGILECKVTLTNGDGNTYFIDKTGENADTKGLSCSIGSPYITTTEMTINVDSFSYTNKRYKKDVWLYGDSYMGSYWREILAKKYNINNYMQAFAGGENSTSALRSFVEDIKHGVPKYILYGMGMNDDNDTEESVNATWLYNTKKFLKIADLYNIIVTMLTVPSVRVDGTLIEDHRKLNQWIRESGRPYIDISRLVEDGDGNWKDGYRSTNPTADIHPSSIGSAIIAAKILNEYPVLSE